MYIRKAVPKILALIFIIGIFSSQIALADVKDAKMEQILSNQKESLKNHSILSGMIKKNNEKSFSRLEKNIEIEESKAGNIESEYAGSFIDDYGNLNVNVTEDADYFAKKYNLSNVKYHTVDNSLKDLKSALKILKEKMSELSISGLGLNIKENKVEVYLKEITPETKKCIGKYVDMPLVNIKISHSDFEYTSSPIVNGERFDVSGIIGHGSIGCSVRTYDGKSGFLISGHSKRSGVKVGDTVVYKGVPVGTIRSLILDGPVDAGFVEVNSSNFSPSKELLNNDSYINASMSIDETDLVQGLFIQAYGCETGKRYGRVKEIDYSVNIKGNEHYDMVLCDLTGQKGDSGGPIVYERYVGSASTVTTLIGMFVASNPSGESVFSKSDRIFERLNVKNY